MKKWMGFREYPDIKEVYVLHHATGTGAQGDAPYEVKEIVGSSDNDDELIALGEQMYPTPTTWEYDRWTIFVNICTEIGKFCHEQMQEDARIRQEIFKADFEAHPENYSQCKIGDYSFVIKKIPALEDSIATKGIKFSSMKLLMPKMKFEDARDTEVPPISYIKPDEE